MTVDSDEITSDDLDAWLDEAETVTAPQPAGGTEVRLWMPVDPETLVELERRANSKKRGLSLVAADALRAGTRVA